MAPYFAEHAALSVTPRGAPSQQHLIEELGARRCRAQQRLIDPEGDEDWALDCLVDLHLSRRRAAAPARRGRRRTTPR